MKQSLTHQGILDNWCLEVFVPMLTEDRLQFFGQMNQYRHHISNRGRETDLKT